MEYVTCHMSHQNGERVNAADSLIAEEAPLSLRC